MIRALVHWHAVALLSVGSTCTFIARRMGIKVQVVMWYERCALKPNCDAQNMAHTSINKILMKLTHTHPFVLLGCDLNIHMLTLEFGLQSLTVDFWLELWHVCNDLQPFGMYFAVRRGPVGSGQWRQSELMHAHEQLCHRGTTLPEIIRKLIKKNAKSRMPSHDYQPT